MKKFLKVSYILYRNAVIRDLKISGAIIAGMLTSLFDGFVSVAIILLVYSKTEYVAGWNVYESLVLITTTQIIITLHSSWTKKGTGSFAESMVRMGEYDFYLTKPFDPMVSISISKPRIYNLIKLPFFLSILLYALFNIGHPILLQNILWFLLLFLCAFLLFYAIRILTIVPAFWVIKSYSLVTITDRVQNIMKYPATIYPRLITVLLSTVFPLFVISYLPVKVLLFEPKISYIVYTVFVTVLFLLLARLFWKWGERSYGSASS